MKLRSYSGSESHSIDHDEFLSPHTQICPDDPFFSLRDFSSFMQEAVITMFVQEEHSGLQTDDNFLGNTCFLMDGIIAIEDSFAS